MEEEEFEKLVNEAVFSLPDKIREKMDNVEVVIEREPSQEQLKKTGIRAGTLLLGLYEGTPKTQWGRSFGMILPDKITIFQDSIENISRTPEEIKETIRNTVWHEIAHHFGLGHKEISELEKKWKKKCQE